MVDACRSFAPTRTRYDRIPSLGLVIKHRHGSTMKLRVWCDRQPSKATRKTSLRHRADESENCGFLNGPPCRSRRQSSNFRARVEWLGLLICPTGCPAILMSSPVCKNISLHPSGKSSLQIRAIPSHTEGRIAIVTNAGWGAVDAAASCARWDRRAGRKTCERSPARGREMLLAYGKIVWS